MEVMELDEEGHESMEAFISGLNDAAKHMMLDDLMGGRVAAVRDHNLHAIFMALITGYKWGCIDTAERMGG